MAVFRPQYKPPALPRQREYEVRLVVKAHAPVREQELAELIASALNINFETASPTSPLRDMRVHLVDVELTAGPR